MDNFSKKNRPVGLITGSGTGPELIQFARRILNVLSDLSKNPIEIVDFPDQELIVSIKEEIYSEELYQKLREFMDRLAMQNGITIRGSIPAPVLYKLRRNFGQSFKISLLNPFPRLSCKPNLNVLLFREAVSGLYHFGSIERVDDCVTAMIRSDKKSVVFMAIKAFEFARLHLPHRVTLVLKTSVLGEWGHLWLEAFEEVSKKFPDIEFVKRPSGAGFSDMWIRPDDFGVVVTDDQGGDVVSDILPTIIYGTRNLIAGASFSRHGHADFQTEHGTIMPLAGKNLVNPLGMLNAVFLGLRWGLGRFDEAQCLHKSMELTLSQGYRTSDFYISGQGQLVKTDEMVEKIISNLYDMWKENA